MPFLHYPKRGRKTSLIGILIFTLLIFALQLTALPSETNAVHDTRLPNPGDPPAPQPCFNPEIVNNNLTDNYITDEHGDPPGGVLEEDLGNGIDLLSDPDAFKFTVVRAGEIGEYPEVPITKNYEFTVNFSNLQALFGNPNSNYAEGQFQDPSHAAASFDTMTTQQLLSYPGIVPNITPKALTDTLRENYVNYVWEKPELAESTMEFYDSDGGNPKTVHELVTEYGPPDIPDNDAERDTWLGNWGKYWEKIPTSYDEFYLGKLEFRAYIGQPVIEKLKAPANEAEAKEYCEKFTLLKTVEFPVPRFFRTASTTGWVNSMMVPKVAQPEYNDLFNLRAGTGAVAGTTTNFVESCFNLAINNPVSKILKKAVKVSMNKLMESQTAYAASVSVTKPSYNRARFSISPPANSAAFHAIIVERIGGGAVEDSGVLPNNATSWTTPTLPAGNYRGALFAFGVAIDSNWAEFNVPDPGCSLSGATTIQAGQQITVVSHFGLAGQVRIGPLPPNGTSIPLSPNLTANNSVAMTIPAGTANGNYEVRGPFGPLCGNITVAPPPPACTINERILYPGNPFTVTSINNLAGPIQIAGAFWDPNPGSPNYRPSVNLGQLSANGTTTVNIPINFDPGTYVVRVAFSGFPYTCTFGALNDLEVRDWDLDLSGATPIHGDTVNFTIAPVGNNHGGDMSLLIYRANPASGGDPCPQAEPFPEYNSHADENVDLNNDNSHAWTRTDVKRGLWRAHLNKNNEIVSDIVCFETRYLLTHDADSRRITFTIAPPVHLNLSSLAGVEIFVWNLNYDALAYRSGALSLGTTEHVWPSASPGQYRACLFNPMIVVALGRTDRSAFESAIWDDPPFSCVEFEVSVVWDWKSAPLESDSCIKVFKEGKAGNAPYCAIYNEKFDPELSNNPDAVQREFENALFRVNIQPEDDCTDPGADGHRLNDQANVECLFRFRFESNILKLLELGGNGKEHNSLKIPPYNPGDPEADRGNWDVCDPPAAGSNFRTCYLTVNVWPNFRIPFLSQTWNNTSYQKVKEVLPTLQKDGANGYFSFYVPKVLEPPEEDPLFDLVTRCNPDPEYGDPNSDACDDLLDFAAGLDPDEYPTFEGCVGTDLFNRANLVRCAREEAKNFTKSLPGQVNTGDGGVAGISTGSGSVLAAVEGEQKERFIGAVECGKQQVRDVMLKPKAHQEILGVTQECSLEANSQPVAPVPGSGTPPGGAACSDDIVAWGDSIAVGLPAPEKRAVSGVNLYSAPAHNAQTGEVIIISIGTNDASSLQSGAVNLATWQSDLVAKINEMKAAGAFPVVLGVRSENYANPFDTPESAAAWNNYLNGTVNSTLSAAATQAGVPFVNRADIVPAGGDGLHLSADQYAQVYDRAVSQATCPNPGGGDPGEPGLPGTLPNWDTCGGRWSFHPENPLGNFGDPNCTFTQDLLYSRLLALDSTNANYWFFTIVPCESRYDPNAYNPASTAGQALGLFQMGHAAYPSLGLDYQIADPAPGPEYDRGDEPWDTQASNAVNYNRNIGGSFAYWGCR